MESASPAIKVRAKVQNLLEQLTQGLYEREEIIKLSLLAAIARESIFLLGPPGVGKSLIARRLKYAFAEGRSFEYLMSRFSTPDEVFGPVSIKKLKDEDKYERLTDAYLPGANIVFLDEIWKAGPAIQNALLTILNERIFRNGGVDEKVDVKAIITASNELPPSETTYGPVWDRFLVRYEMGNIKAFGKFIQMITDTNDLLKDNISRKWKLEQNEWESWHQQIDQIELSPEVLNTIQIVKLRLDEYNAKPNNQSEPILIHDRRWKKIVRLLRTSAFLNGRQTVDLMDCFLMIHCLWHRPKQKEVITDMVKSVIRDHGYAIPVNLNNLKKEVRSFEQEVQNEIKVKHTSEEEEAMPVQEHYFELVKETDEFAGHLIEAKDFHLLDRSDYKVTNLFDNELNLVSRLKIKKGLNAHTLEIRHNTRIHVVRLKTRKNLSTQFITKKPHHLVEAFWDKKYTQLDQFIKGHLHRIKTEPPEQILHLHQNLFVPKDLAAIVKSNLHEVAEQLETLSIRLDKIKHSYAGIVE